MGMFAKKNNGLENFLKIAAAIEGLISKIEQDLEALFPELIRLMEEASNIAKAAQPLENWDEMSSFIERNKEPHLSLLFTLGIYCDYIGNKFISMFYSQGMANNVQGMELKVKLLRERIDNAIGLIFNQLVPVDVDNSSGKLGGLYAFEVLREEVDFLGLADQHYGKVLNSFKALFRWGIFSNGRVHEAILNVQKGLAIIESNNEKSESEFVSMDVIERMQVWVGCGRTKESFGQMTDRESEIYDSIQDSYNQAKEKGLTFWIVRD